MARAAALPLVKGEGCLGCSFAGEGPRHVCTLTVFFSDSEVSSTRAGLASHSPVLSGLPSSLLLRACWGLTCGSQAPSAHPQQQRRGLTLRSPWREAALPKAVGCLQCGDGCQRLSVAQYCSSHVFPFLLDTFVIIFSLIDIVRLSSSTSLFVVVFDF